MSESNTATVEVTEVVAKPKRKRKAEVKKAKVKRSVGRPSVYNRDKIIAELKKFEGQRGGAKAAHASLLKYKGFQTEDGKGISYPNIIVIAKKAGITFAAGRPVEKPKPAKLAKAA